MHLLIWLLLCCNVMYAQIQLHISDSYSGEPISDALIFDKQNSFVSQTDSAGKVYIDTSKYNRISKLYIQHEEYLTDSITLSNNKSIVKISLDKPKNNSTLQDVVISGTMSARKISDSPIAVEVYSPEFFKKNPSPSVFESLSMVNGVQPQINCNVCSTGDIHINGLEGPYTMVLIDGMPIVSSLATVYGFQGIPQSIIKRVEVVKGASSTLYGSEALAGVINIITKDPANVKKLDTDISVTSIGELNMDLATKVAFKPKFNILFGGNYFDYNTPRDRNNDNFTDITLQRRISVFSKGVYEHRNATKTHLAMRVLHENRWGGELNYAPQWYGGDSVYGEQIRTQRFEAIGSHQFAFMKQLKIDFSYNYHQQNSFYGTVPFNAQQQTFFTQLVKESKLGSRISMVSGLPFRFTYYDDNTVATDPSAVRTWLPGIFSQAEYKLNARNTALLGLRLDHNSKHGFIFTPRLAYKLNTAKKGILRATIGSGYRVVNVFTEDHAALTGSRKVVFAEELKPERTWNLNTSYTKDFLIKNGFVKMDVSVFYTYFLNKIIPDYTQNADQILYYNISGYAISRGLASNIDLQLDKGFKANLGYTFLDVYRIQNNIKQKQLLSPKSSVKFTLGYEFKTPKLQIDLTGDYKSAMYLPILPNDFRPERSPAFILLGTQVTKKNKQTEYYLGAKNLLNFMPKYPIMRYWDPFDKKANDSQENPQGYTFDTAYNYAPILGLKFYFGVRYSF